MKQPVRLEKKQDSLIDEIEVWVLTYSSFILLGCFILLLILFIVTCFFIVGISAVESGYLRNFIGGI